jgi:hypothetical protein
MKAETEYRSNEGNDSECHYFMLELFCNSRHILVIRKTFVHEVRAGLPVDRVCLLIYSMTANKLLQLYGVIAWLLKHE